MAKGPKSGGNGHRKPGAADKGKSNIDKTGKTGKHHGGNLSGGSGMSDVAAGKGGKGGGKK